MEARQLLGKKLRIMALASLKYMLLTSTQKILTLLKLGCLRSAHLCIQKLAQRSKPLIALCLN
tara:strand:+ start:20532 stop:20720 length:189 start_codon:yes stop_codon:yes gene_type:complete